MPIRLRTTVADAEEISAPIRLWILRLLVLLDGQKKFLGNNSFSNDALAVALGLKAWIDMDELDFPIKEVRSALRKLHKEEEQRCKSPVQIPASLNKNLERLSKLIGLSKADKEILAFAILLKCNPMLEDAADILGNLSQKRLHRILSVVLSIPEANVRYSLSGKGLLIQSGLISANSLSLITQISYKLELLSDGFADSMFSDIADPIDLLKEAVIRAPQAKLNIDDYRHVATSLIPLQPYLDCATKVNRIGVNILIYGAPGTGKSELTRIIAEKIGVTLFEVPSEDSNGTPNTGEDRLRSFRTAQYLLSRRPSLLLFDEVEDIFDDGEDFLGKKSTAQLRKGWMNRMLEQNPVPTIWLSNSIGNFDPAFIRRFDMVLELPMPPRQKREQILSQNCAGILDSTTIIRLAEAESLAPAVITQTASVINCIKNALPPNGAAATFELLINNTLEAQGHSPIRKTFEHKIIDRLYDPALVSTNVNLAKITEGLIREKTGRLCLYGPSGTGKTAFGKWLAHQIGAPLLVKRVSDLMSMWVGESEKNIAASFKQAERDGAVLLLDEIDSFLQDRRTAQRSWEISLVNEMLTQMESFNQIFIASTNLIDNIDQAALRRFDLKIKFDYLAPEQSWELLHRYCTLLSLAAPKSEQYPSLARLRNLTPGDFATVMRQHHFSPLFSASDWIKALDAECRMKETTHSSIGFLN